MAKVPTIYDIGNFRLDWNNAENIANPGVGIATKDGVLHLHCLDNTSPEGLSAAVIVAPELPSDSTDDSIDLFVKDSSSKFISVGGYETENKGSFHLIIPVHKGESFYFYEKHVETVFKRQFIPFLYQGVEPTPGCVSYVIETGHNQDNTAFYRKYSDGYIEQWGIGKDIDHNIEFLIPFSDTNYHISITHCDKMSASAIQAYEVWNKSTDKFTLHCAVQSSDITLSEVSWKACGY